MPHYYVNIQENDGVHVMHMVKREPCQHGADEENQKDVGYHIGCHYALEKARETFPDWSINGCYFCCNDCHET